MNSKRAFVLGLLLTANCTKATAAELSASSGERILERIERPHNQSACGIRPKVAEFITSMQEKSKIVAHQDQGSVLDNFSIDLNVDQIPRKFVVAPWRSVSETVCEDHKPNVYTGLMVPGKPNYVAIIQSNSCSPTILNPDGYEYGPIPALDKLTPSDAEVLWGAPTIEANQRTYKLVSAANDVYFVDISFDGSSLRQYRVRGKSLRGEPVWCSPLKK